MAGDRILFRTHESYSVAYSSLSYAFKTPAKTRFPLEDVKTDNAIDVAPCLTWPRTTLVSEKHVLDPMVYESNAKALAVKLRLIPTHGA